MFYIISLNIMLKDREIVFPPINYVLFNATQLAIIFKFFLEVASPAGISINPVFGLPSDNRVSTVLLRTHYF